MHRRVKSAICYLIPIFFLTSCQTILSPPAEFWPAAPNGHFMHVGAFLQVTGTAKAASGSREESREKAIIDAWDRLLSYIHRLPLAGYGYVKVKADENPDFKKRLVEFAYTAAVVETQYSGKTAAVVIRMNKNKINAVLETNFQ